MTRNAEGAITCSSLRWIAYVSWPAPFCAIVTAILPSGERTVAGNTAARTGTAAINAATAPRHFHIAIPLVATYCAANNIENRHAPRRKRATPNFRCNPSDCASLLSFYMRSMTFRVRENFSS